MHAHVFPEAIAPSAIATLSQIEGVHAYYDGTVDGLIASMDRGGVDRSLIAPVATKPSQVRSINDWVLGVPRARIIPFGAMHPDFEQPAEELARLKDGGIQGIKLHSQNQDFAPDEPRLTPIYEAARDLDMIVLFHAGGFVVDEGTEARPVQFAAMLDAQPGLTCILAHMGSYMFWDEVREHLCGRDVYLDTAYVPRHLPDAEFLALIRHHGVERVLFGSDGPWTDVGVELAHMRQLGLTRDELTLVLGENAERLLQR